MQENQEKYRRDNLFCQLAGFKDETRPDKDGWIVFSEAARQTSCSEDEIQHVVQRLVEDGWIEVKDSTNSIPSSVRLTAVGKARARVICKNESWRNDFEGLVASADFTPF